MNKEKQNKKTAAKEVERLLNNAENQLPGVIELVKAYGNYEETVLLIQQYLEMDQPQPSLVSSNQSISTI